MRTARIDGCAQAAEHRLPSAIAACAQVCTGTLAGDRAIAAALDALERRDAGALRLAAATAPANAQGARILHFWGELQQDLGEPVGAEMTFRRAFVLRIECDPHRATNTALALLALTRSAWSAAETLRLARHAWVLAERSGDKMVRAMAAGALIEVLIDLGELRTVQLIIDRMGDYASQEHLELANARLQAARGRYQLAVAHYLNASKGAIATADSAFQLGAEIEAAQLLIGLGDLAAASNHLARTSPLVDAGYKRTLDIRCRLAAARAAIRLANGDPGGALAMVTEMLRQGPIDAARLRLQNLRGDALAALDRSLDAEAAWHQAAEQLETWRESLPVVDLRAGLIEAHRHALEQWLDSAARRGDVSTTLEIARRLLGRGVIDRIREPSSDERAINDAADKIADRLAVRLDATRELRPLPKVDLHAMRGDIAIIMLGARSVWSADHVLGRWAIREIGARDEVLAWVKQYRADLDARDAADALGKLLFPDALVGKYAGPLVVMLDTAFAELPLAGLRVGRRYLIERVELVELLAPDLVAVELPERMWTPPVVLGDPLRNLPGAADEAREVGALVGGTLRIGDQVDREAIASGRDAELLHLSAHAAIDGGIGTLALRTGPLSAIDLLRMQLAPRLAVIATCRSSTASDPSSSIVAALLATGTAGVIGAKIAIDDAASRELIIDLYRQRAIAQPARALALAQRNAIARGRPPRDWAGFAFFGTGGSLSQRLH